MNLVPDSIYTRIEIEDGVVLGAPGYPAFPYRAISLLLPQNEIITNVVIDTNNEEFLDSCLIYPIQMTIPFSYTGDIEFTEPDSEIYNSSDPFPEQQNTSYSTHFLAGYSVGFLAITPFTYIPETGELSYFDSITVTVETDYNKTAETAADKFLYDNSEVERRLKNLVENFDDRDAFYDITKERQDDAFDYIIVTSEEYADDFQPLADYHSRRGYRTKVESISYIYDNYTGVDDADKLRNYFIDQYENHGPIQYVLLGGDTDVIPYRPMWVHFGSSNILADMYFAGLDRMASGPGPDWDINDNDYWGEGPYYGEIEEADIEAEFYIGRICVNNSTEIENFINKTILYSESPVTEEVMTCLLVGEQLDDNTWGGDYMQFINNLIFNYIYFPPCFEISTLYEMNGSWTTTDLTDALCEGPNLVCHIGHGDVNKCLGIMNTDLTTSNITNNGYNHNLINGYSQACFSGSFDNLNIDYTYVEDCFAEKITTMETGAVTFIANSRSGFYEPGGTNGPSQWFNLEWIDVLFNWVDPSYIYTIGGANQLSKDNEYSMALIVSVNSYYRQCCYELNVFGDPAIDLWTEIPGILTPDYPTVIVPETSSINITVIVEGYFGFCYNPARFTVYDDDTIYGYGETDGTGGVETLYFDIIPEDPGIINLSIIAHNYLPPQFDSYALN